VFVPPAMAGRFPPMVTPVIVMGDPLAPEFVK
jgi:hypothetical protein